MSYEIKVTDTSKLNDVYQKLIASNEIYDNTDSTRLLNTLKIVDKLIEKEDKDNLSISNQTIDLSIFYNNKNIDLCIKMGEGNFEKGLQHLINVGSKKLETKVNENLIKEADKTLNKNYDKNIFKNSLDGTIELLSHVSSGAGKEVDEFLQSFKRAYNIANYDKQKTPTEKDKQTNIDFIQKFAEFKKKHKIKEIDQATNKNKDRVSHRESR
ncbi:hypothetical protein [Helicobacter trogontum]|uniref:Uncharacterized protein n=1 Tax=Helicobacter trogontum TaxID=50960 RepID=A0A4U8S288_9HELI|nr:hypothetical protein [Helicobacter trogontum]TLD79737.1 hypothetical protein LS81_010290 [Helicobacter trogontum]